MPRWCRSDRRFPKAICRDDVGATSDLAVLAWARILLLFECFGTGLQRTCALAWARILLLFGCFGTGLQRTFCLAWARILLLFACFGTGLQKGLAPRGCQTKELFFMGSKGDGKHFVGLRFAWHGLESCCCSSVSEPASKGLAPMVSEPASHRGCQTKELFFMGSKGDGKHFVGLRFAWHGLESCCCSSVSEPASKGLAPMVSEPASHRGCQTKELFFMGSKGDGKHFVGLRFAWHGLESCCCSNVSEPASKGLAPMVSEPASHRGCQTKELFFMGSKGDGKHFVGLRFAWHGLESCCCSNVSEPASKGLAPMVSEPASHRGCQTKELFFMGSKGDGKHFVGLRFAWHGLESCCCSSVSESASKGLAPMVSEPASHRGCQTKELFFMGSKGDGKHFVGLRFAWHGLESCCCSSVSEPASKGLAPMVSEPALRQWFRNQPRTEGARQKNCFLWVPKVTGSILSGCVLLGMGSNPAAVRMFRNRPPRDLRQWFRNQPRTEGARQKSCFLWVPKVTGSILSGCVLLGMGSNPAAVRVFRNRPPRDLRQWFRNQARTEGARQKNCFLWVPKVTGSILSGCVLLGMGSNPAAVRVFRNRPPRDLRQWFRNQPRTEGARQKSCFLWVPKVTGSILSGCVLLGMGSNPAAVRVFRNRPPRDLRQWFRNQPRTEGARQKNCFLWVPKVTGSILSGCVLLGMGSNPAAVRVFRNRPPRDLRQWFRNQPRTEGARQKSCFLWVPKGSRKHQINYNCINEQLEVSPFAPQGEGSAAWAVALQSGSAVLCRRPSHLWL